MPSPGSMQKSGQAGASPLRRIVPSVYAGLVHLSKQMHYSEMSSSQSGISLQVVTMLLEPDVADLLASIHLEDPNLN